jgi:hypothetical protein
LRISGGYGAFVAADGAGHSVPHSVLWTPAAPAAPAPQPAQDGAAKGVVLVGVDQAKLAQVKGGLKAERVQGSDPGGS